MRYEKSGIDVVMDGEDVKGVNFSPVPSHSTAHRNEQSKWFQKHSYTRSTRTTSQCTGTSFPHRKSGANPISDVRIVARKHFSSWLRLGAANTLSVAQLQRADHDARIPGCFRRLIIYVDTGEYQVPYNNIRPSAKSLGHTIRLGHGPEQQTKRHDNRLHRTERGASDHQ